MRTCGRQINAMRNGTVAGPPMDIEAPVPQGTYPVLDFDGRPNVVEWKMYKNAAIESPPQRAHWTTGASGGCIPICAAEIGANRQVRWIYLVHAHYGNDPIDVTAHAAQVADVYVAFMVSREGCTSFDAADIVHAKPWMEKIDPRNVIPSQNGLLIYTAAVSLGITQNASVGVMQNNAVVPPVATAPKHCQKCYLSTATCSALGLPDDCDELVTLRRYRDEVLMQSAQGRRDVEAYYALAPEVVERIDRGPDRDLVYRWIYERYVRPSVASIRRGQFGEAHATFRDLLRVARSL